MGILDREKKFFDPNCQTRDDGLIECAPVLREGDVERKAHVVLQPAGGGDYMALTLKGDSKAIEELEKFLRGRIIKK